MLRKRLTRLIAAGLVIICGVYSAVNTDLRDVAFMSWVVALSGLVLAVSALRGEEEPEH